MYNVLKCLNTAVDTAFLRWIQQAAYFKNIHQLLLDVSPKRKIKQSLGHHSVSAMKSMHAVGPHPTEVLMSAKDECAFGQRKEKLA